jgi:predicted Rossmann fold flavoprotein
MANLLYAVMQKAVCRNTSITSSFEPSSLEFDVIVLGGGAAGLMAAFTAGRRGRRVLVVEHSDRVGRKILISGGGRCNFTNLGANADNYLSENPHFAKSALARYTPLDFLDLVRRHDIAFHEKTLGQLFCDGSAQQIVAMLERECRDAGVEIRTSIAVESVQKTEAGFIIKTTAGTLRADAVIVATGGLSIPKMGATGIGYEIAQAFDHRIVEPRAGLVPLTFSAADRETWCDLSGLSTEVTAHAPRPPHRGTKPVAFREKLLITHRGLSGPAVLQVSSYWRAGQALAFDLAPGRQVFTALAAQTHGRDWDAAYAALKASLPARFAERYIRVRSVAADADFTNNGIARMEAELHAWTLNPAGTEGFEKAEVTSGGVSTETLDARTMESRRVDRLFFIGEVVDVTGWLGGYNFQWAWASGSAAGQHA